MYVFVLCYVCAFVCACVCACVCVRVGLLMLVSNAGSPAGRCDNASLFCSSHTNTPGLQMIFHGELMLICSVRNPQGRFKVKTSTLRYENAICGRLEHKLL